MLGMSVATSFFHHSTELLSPNGL